MKRFIALLLVLTFCLSIIPLPMTGSMLTAAPGGLTYTVEYYDRSDVDSTRTFKITAVGMPTRSTDVYYRVWSGNSQGAVEPYTGHVTFDPQDYSSNAAEKLVVVKVGEYDEGLSSYTLDVTYPTAGDYSDYTSLPTVRLTLVGVDGEGQIDWDKQSAAAPLPHRELIDAGVIYLPNDPNNEFYVTNSLEVDFRSIPKDDSGKFLIDEIPDESETKYGPTVTDATKSALYALEAIIEHDPNNLFQVSALLFKDLPEQYFRKSFGCSVGAFFANLQDIDPSAGLTVNLLNQGTFTESDGTYTSGELGAANVSGQAYDNSYYGYTDAQYLLYLENNAWNNGKDRAWAENVELRIYEMQDEHFDEKRVESSQYSWTNVVAPADSVELFAGWEDYTYFDKKNSKSYLPDASGGAGTGMRHFNLNTDSVLKLEGSPITLPDHTDPANNNYSNDGGYQPVYTQVDRVFLLDSPIVGYYLELPKAGSGCAYLLEDNYIYFMVKDSNAPEAVSITLSDDQYGLNNEIRASVEFSEAIQEAAIADARIKVKTPDGSGTLAVLYPERTTGGLPVIYSTGGNRVEFVGELNNGAGASYDGADVYDSVILSLEGSFTDAAQNTRKYGDSASGDAEVYTTAADTRIVGTRDVVAPSTPRVSAQTASGAAYIPGERVEEPVTLTVLSHAGSGIRSWQVCDENSDRQWIDLTADAGSGKYGSYTIGADGRLQVTVTNTGRYRLAFRSISETGQVSDASAAFDVDFRAGAAYTGTFTADYAGYTRGWGNDSLNLHFNINRRDGDEGRCRVSYDVLIGNKLYTSGAVVFGDGDDEPQEVITEVRETLGWFEVEGDNDGEFVYMILSKIELDTGAVDGDGQTIWEDISREKLTSETAVKKLALHQAQDNMGLDGRTAAFKLSPQHDLSAMYYTATAANPYVTSGSGQAHSQCDMYTKKPFSTTLPQNTAHEAFHGDTTEQLYMDMGARFYFRVKGEQDMRPRFVFSSKDLDLRIGDFFHGWEDTNNVRGDSFDLPGTHKFNNSTQTTNSDMITTVDGKEYYIRNDAQVDMTVTLPPTKERILDEWSFLDTKFDYGLDYQVSWFAEDTGQAPQFKDISARTYRFKDGDYFYLSLNFSEPVQVDPEAKLKILRSTTQKPYGELAYTSGSGTYTLLFSGYLTNYAAGDTPIYLSEPKVTVLWPVGTQVTDMTGHIVTDAPGNVWVTTLDGVPVDTTLPEATVRDGGIFSIGRAGTVVKDGKPFFFAEIQRTGASVGDQTVYVRTFNENADAYYEDVNVLLHFGDGDTAVQRVYIPRFEPADTDMASYTSSIFSHDKRFFGVEIYNVFGGGRIPEDHAAYVENPNINHVCSVSANSLFGPDRYSIFNDDNGVGVSVVRFGIDTPNTVNNNAVYDGTQGQQMVVNYYDTVQGRTPGLSLRARPEDANYYETLPGVKSLVVVRALAYRHTWKLSAANFTLYLKKGSTVLFKGYEDYDNVNSSKSAISRTNYLPGYSDFNHSQWPVATKAVSLKASALDDYGDYNVFNVSKVFELDNTDVTLSSENDTKGEVSLIDPVLFYLYTDSQAPQLQSVDVDKDYTLPGRILRVSLDFDELVFANAKQGKEAPADLGVELYAENDPNTVLMRLKYGSGFGTDTLTFQGIMIEELLPDNLSLRITGNVWDNAGNQCTLVGGSFVDSNVRNAPLAPTFDYAFKPTAAVNGYYSEATVTIASSEADITIYYSLDGHSESSFFKGASGTGKATVTLTESGSHTIYAMAVRESDGAKSAFIAAQTIHIDNSSPAIEVRSSVEGWTNQDVYLMPLVYGGLASHRVTVQRRDVDILADPEDMTDRSVFRVSENGVYRFTVTNGFGRSASVDVPVDNIDKTAPVLTNAVFHKGKTAADGATPVYVTALVNENQSGLHHFRYYFEYYTGADESSQKLMTELAETEAITITEYDGTRKAVFAITAPAGSGHILHLFPVDAAGNASFQTDNSFPAAPAASSLRTLSLSADPVDRDSFKSPAGSATSSSLKTLPLKADPADEDSFKSPAASATSSSLRPLPLSADPVDEDAFEVGRYTLKRSRYQFTLELDALRQSSSLQAVLSAAPDLTVRPSSVDGWVKAMPAFEVSAQASAGLAAIKWQVLDADDVLVTGLSGTTKYDGELTASFNFIPRGLTAAGSYTLQVSAADRRGGVSIVTVPVKFDQDAPAAPALLVNGEAFASDVSYSVADTFRLQAPAQADGQSPVTAQFRDAAGSGDWIDAVYGGVQLEPGTHSLELRTKDEAGNVSDPATCRVTVTEPATPYAKVTAIAAGDAPYTGQWTEQAVTFTLSTVGGEAGTTYTYYYSADGGTNWTPLAGSAFTATASGRYHFGAAAEGGGAPAAYIRTAYPVYIDKTPPGTPDLSASIPASSGWITAHNLTVARADTAADAAPETLYYRYDTNAEWMAASGGTVPLTSGSYTLYVKVRDAAGNESAPAAQALKVDNAAPVLELTAEITDGEETAPYNGAPTRYPVRLTANALAASGIARVEYSTDSRTWTALAPSNDLYTLELTASVNAVYYVRAVSNAGLIGTAREQQVIVDQDAPSMAAVAIARAGGDRGSGSIYALVPTVTIVPPREEGLTVGYVLIHDGVPGQLAAMPETGVLPASLWARDGSYELRVYVRDAAGNIAQNDDGDNYLNRSFILDTTAPALAAGQAPYGVTIGDSAPALDMNGKFTDASALTYVFMPYTRAGSHWVAGEAVISPTGVYTPPAGFTGKVTVCATDAAGNESALYTHFFVVEDNTAPLVTMNLSGQKLPGIDAYAAATLSLVAQDDETGLAKITVKVYHNGVFLSAVSQTITCGGENRQVFSRAIPESGLYTARVTAADVAGNVSAEYYEEFYITFTPESPDDTPTAPTITTQPTGQTVTEGSTATFTVAATGDPAPSYQWQQLAMDSGATWSNAVGATNDPSYTTPTTTMAMNGYKYRCVAANGVAPNATSNAVTLTVNAAPPTPPTPPTSGSGGSGGSVTPTYNLPSSGSGNDIKATAAVVNGTATVTVDESKLDALLRDTATSGSVNLNAGLNKNVDTVKIPAAVIKKVAAAAIDDAGAVTGLTVTLDSGTVELDAAALAALSDQTTGDYVTITVKEKTPAALNQQQREAMSGEYANSVIVEVAISGGGGAITDYKGGRITVTIPYTLKEGEVASGVRVWHLASDGTLELMACRYDETTQTVSFVTDHLSIFIVGYDATAAWENPFSDVAEGDWFYDSVMAVVRAGLFGGTSATTFEPRTPMTRAMFVTVLWRLAGEPGADLRTNFTDVAVGAWYAEAVGWAARNEIVNGTGAATFSPEEVITREQMAAILYRYHNGVPGAAAVSFTDAAHISPWAAEAVAWASARKLFAGYPDGSFKPQNTATRAEVATVFQRLLEP